MKIVKADGFVARLKGWLGRPCGEPDEGLWLLPCRAVHTGGMRFAVDLVFLDQAGKVLRVDAQVRPWRIRWHWQAHSVLELTAGTARRKGFDVGQRLRHLQGVDWLPLLLCPGWWSCAATLAAVSLLTLGGSPRPAWAGPPMIDIPIPVIVSFQAEWSPGQDTEADAADPLADWAATATTGRAQAPASAQPLPVLGPLRLTRPLAPETVARWLDEAESLYLGRHWAQAIEAYRGLLEIEPRHAIAWMRLGNAHHQRHELAAAARAYRRAAQPPQAQTVPVGGSERSSITGEGPTSGNAQDTIRAKSLVNLAAVNLELATQSLQELGRLGGRLDPATQGLRDALAVELTGIDRTLGRHLDVPAPQAGSRSVRRPFDPQEQSPEPLRPRVDYLQDAPRRAATPAIPSGSSGIIHEPRSVR